MELLLLTAVGLQVGSGLSGSFSQAAASESAAEFESSQLETQARLSDLNAASAETRGRDDEAEQKRKTKLLIGRQRAALAAQGIEIDSGSALDLQLESAEFGAADALTIKNNAFREATGHRIESIDSRNRAKLAKITGKSKARSSILTGGLTAASDITRGASKLL